ncbi:MFS transporter [Myxozyma melibiosi]|uniref:MFS transporter n=1 Tax=Myxozyma melibiosi TaxID=54550 RepID=A0ABR1F9E6_9ASCO
MGGTLRPSVSFNEEKPSNLNVEYDPIQLLGDLSGEFDGVTVPAKGTPEREEMEKKLKFKIDMTIMPVVIAMYILNYLDRNNIAAAKLGTLREDLNLTDTNYSTCVSILFVGYILMQIPSNLLLEKLGRPSLYLPLAMAIWGVLSACTAAVQGFGGLFAVRFLIGFAEAVFYPGVMFYLSCWYTKYEIAKRSAIFVTGSWVSGAFSGLIAYGIMKNMDGARGLEAWRWLFLIEGVITVAVALVSIFILPELPATTKWLSKEERLLGVIRMIEDVGQADDDHAPKLDANGEPVVEDLHGKFKTAMEGFILASKDFKVCIAFFMMFFLAVTAGVNTVFPSIVKSLGYGTEETYLLTAPPWILVAITSVLNSYHSDYKQERYFHFLWGPTLSLVGFVIGIATTKTAPRYVAMMLLLQVYNSWSLGYAWLASIIPRPPIKRAAAVACVNIGGNIPNIFVPYIYYSKASPHYYAGFAVCIATALLGLVSATVLKIRLNALNKKLAAGGIVDGLDGSTGFRFLS